MELVRRDQVKSKGKGSEQIRSPDRGHRMEEVGGMENKILVELGRLGLTARRGRRQFLTEPGGFLIGGVFQGFPDIFHRRQLQAEADGIQVLRIASTDFGNRLEIRAIEIHFVDFPQENQNKADRNKTQYFIQVTH